MRQILTTDRLTLRPLTLDDAAWFAGYAGKPEVARMTGSVTTNITEMEAEFWIMRNLSRRERGLAYIYVIEHNSVRVGMIDLFKRTEDSALEIGYSLVPEFWGLGFMYEACKAIIAEGRETLGATRIAAGVFADNPASLRLLTKLGFTAARTHEQWFSMGRMEKAKGVTLTLEIEDDTTLNEWGQKDDGLSIPSRHMESSALKHYA